MKISVILVIILIAASLTFGQAQQNKIKLHTKEKATRQEIAKQIPIGSSIEDARRIMETNGFSCVLSQPFPSPNEIRPVVQENKIEDSFLYCRKDKFLWTLRRPWESLVYTRLWEVAIVHKNNVVSDIFVSIWRNCEL
jgi:hypothetical protein